MNRPREFLKDLKGQCKQKDSCQYMHPVKCKTQREKGHCKDKECKLFHVKKTKQTPKPAVAPPAKKNSNGNEKTPSAPPPPPADSNAEVMKALNSNTF